MIERAKKEADEDAREDAKSLLKEAAIFLYRKADRDRGCSFLLSCSTERTGWRRGRKESRHPGWRGMETPGDEACQNARADPRGKLWGDCAGDE